MTLRLDQFFYPPIFYSLSPFSKRKSLSKLQLYAAIQYCVFYTDFISTLALSSVCLYVAV